MGPTTTTASSASAASSAASTGSTSGSTGSKTGSEVEIPNLGPSLSILPVLEPLPHGGHRNKAKGTMSMKDVMESINKKNNMFKATSTVGSSALVNAASPATATASGSTTTTTSSGEQPLENDV